MSGKYTLEQHEEYHEQVEKEEQERWEAARKASAKRAFIVAGGDERDFDAHYEQAHRR